MSVYKQGDQYILPITVKKSGTIVTYNDIEDIRVQINDTLFSLAGGNITYDNTNQQWWIYVTEEFTRTLSSSSMIQIGLNYGDEILYSKIECLPFDISIIQEDWYNETNSN